MIYNVYPVSTIIGLSQFCDPLLYTILLTLSSNMYIGMPNIFTRECKKAGLGTVSTCFGSFNDQLFFLRINFFF